MKVLVRLGVGLPACLPAAVIRWAGGVSSGGLNGACYYSSPLPSGDCQLGGGGVVRLESFRPFRTIHISRSCGRCPESELLGLWNRIGLCDRLAG